MAVTTGMLGHGFYDHHSAPQWAAIETVLPWLEDAITTLALAVEPPPIGIADFGCSEGRNSVRVMQRLIPAVRAQTRQPILTIHSDLPSNDYTGLLGRLRADGHSVFGDGAFSAVVGGSMFEQLLPASMLQLAMTFNAIGFLSRRPVARLPGYILPNGPSRLRGVGDVGPEEAHAFAAQAASDVESFLWSRAAELRPGGKLLVQVFGAGEAGRTCDGIYDALNDAVLEALDQGLIDRDGYEAYYQPVYFRTLPELTSPVVGPAAPLGAVFRLERAETYEVEVPFVRDFRQSGDAATFAARYTGFFRAFCEPVLRQAFPRPDVDQLADTIFDRAERMIRDHPERYEFHYVSVAMLLTRLNG